MSLPRNALAALALALAAPAALADEPAAEDDIETVSGKQLPPTRIEEVEEGLGAITSAQRKALAERPYTTVVYRGAEALDLEPEFVHGIREGLAFVYLRDYKGARKHFKELESRFPGTGVSSVVNTLVWQAVMLENFDFQYDDQYWASSRQARTDLEAALARPGAEGWEHFLLGGIAGIEAIHTMRHEKYTSALRLAFEAMDHIAASKSAAPDFTDLLLADGMYNYWRTVVTLSVDVLPDFGDHRVEGIQQMRAVEDAGIFLSPPASLSLAFTWLEERELHRALGACLRNKRQYPDNVINNLMLGNVYTYMRKFDSALRTYGEILAVAPDNKRVHYYRGIALMRSGDLDAAVDAFQTYLGFDYMEDYQRAGGHYRLGQAYFRMKRYDAAEEQWKAASKLTRHKGARRKLDMIKEKRKSGQIPG